MHIDRQQRMMSKSKVRNIVISLPCSISTEILLLIQLLQSNVSIEIVAWQTKFICTQMPFIYFNHLFHIYISESYRKEFNKLQRKNHTHFLYGKSTKTEKIF